MYNIKELLSNIIGKNEDGFPKSATIFNLLELDSDYEFKNELTGVDTYAPYIDIKSVNNFTLMDLVFKNDYDADLRRLYAALELYGNKKNEDIDDSESHFIASFTIVPVEMNGRIAISAIEPVFWSIQPHMPGEQNNTIRLLFLNDDFKFIEGPAVDINEIKETVDKEIEEEKAEIRKRIQLEEQRQEYLDERNKKLEELRRGKDNN